MTILTENIDPTIKNYHDLYLQKKNDLAGKNIAWLNELRTSAMNTLLSHGFPSIKDEEWKYTNTHAITKHIFTHNFLKADNNQINFSQYIPANLNAHRIVFIDGQYAEHLNRSDNSNPGLEITSLAQKIENNSEQLKPYLGKLSNNQRDGFKALNDSFINDGAYIHISKNQSIESPIHIIHISTAQAEKTFNSLRNIIILEENSRATILESYISTNNDRYFTSLITEVFLNQHARLEHYKLQQENSQAYHIGTLAVQQQNQSSFTSHSFMFGGNIVRSDTQVSFNGEHAECKLNGLYLSKAKQHIDHHTLIEHAKPNNNSNQYYKGILADFSRAVFNGKVIVQPGAYKTNAKQNNKNLLLSNNAEIDTKPQLEIYNDDVQCTHGATVGQINNDALFYLQSRGINHDKAYGMLINAFAKEILEQVPIVAIKEYLINCLKQHFTFNFVDSES